MALMGFYISQGDQHYHPYNYEFNAANKECYQETDHMMFAIHIVFVWIYALNLKDHIFKFIRFIGLCQNHGFSCKCAKSHLGVC